MLTIGVDTYITSDEANEYVKQFYLASDSLRIQWEVMTEEDREVYLRRAFVRINQLPYTGKRKSPKQPLPFPRQDGNLLKVKYAQVEQALATTDTVATQEVEDRQRLRRAGVQSYKIGDLQENFYRQGSESNATMFGLCEKAYYYLSEYLTGGYKICTSIKRPCGLK